MNTNTPQTDKIFKELVKEFQNNGFTKEQAEYLLRFLNNFIPVI